MLSERAPFDDEGEPSDETPPGEQTVDADQAEPAAPGPGDSEDASPGPESGGVEEA